jgi:NADH:ubiquinone oxidoreductase subunit 2 (subunit N)
MSKWQIFVAGFQTQNIWIIVLMIFMALNSVLSLAYYAPLVNMMYRRSPSAQVLAGKRLSLAIVLPLLVMMTAVIVLGFMPQLMDWVTVPAARNLIALFGK